MIDYVWRTLQPLYISLQFTSAYSQFRSLFRQQLWTLRYYSFNNSCIITLNDIHSQSFHFFFHLSFTVLFAIEFKWFLNISWHSFIPTFRSPLLRLALSTYYWKMTIIIHAYFDVSFWHISYNYSHWGKTHICSLTKKCISFYNLQRQIWE
jgi:hypothetical protein